jgi:hypothetical protein
MQNNDRPCIACGKAKRYEGTLHCQSPKCRDMVNDMSFETVNNIRMDEAMATWRANPGGEFYFHFTERK